MSLPAPAPIKVLVVIPSLDTGGAEMDLVRNLPRIDRAKFAVSVCAFIAPGRLAPQLTAQGIEVIAPQAAQPSSGGGANVPRASRIPAWLPPPLRDFVRALPLRRAIGNMRIYARYARQISRLIRERDIDVVHAVLPNAYFAATLAAKWSRRPLVMSRLSLNWYQRSMPVFGLIERHMLHRLADAAICNCDAIRKDLVEEGMAAGKITIIPNGIESAAGPVSDAARAQARMALGVPAESFVFTKVANLHRYKGHADLIAALALAQAQLPAGWVLLCAGRATPEQTQALQSLAAQSGLSGNIRFLGERGDVPTLLQAADIHVSASHTEGFPNNVLEAMNAGLPVVATDVGGVPEMIVDGESGFLVPPHDPPALARALVTLARDETARRAMGAKARERVDAYFSLARSASALAKVYEQLAGQDQARLPGGGL